MEHFVVSARKYRPQSFDQVVGQKAITQTLQNAIQNNQLPQALLFTGPRGVGKTSCARILATVINEVERSEFTVFELDAASNNSVDDIRSLIDQVRIPPQVGKYKVYIIDEVHMLSQSAFNAFLKTLEEPPSHAIFILATTEKHKILPTILSRCQIFDFKRITLQDITEHLKEIADKEGITYEESALYLIAQKADGAMRDALSTYDRVVNFCGKHLAVDAVSKNLNVIDSSTYLSITSHILQADIPQVLLAYHEILNNGFDGQYFIIGLASHFRDLLVCLHQDTKSLLEVSTDDQQAFYDQSLGWSQQELIFAIDLATDCERNYKSSKNQRLLVELCLMQLCSIKEALKKKDQ